MNKSLEWMRRAVSLARKGLGHVHPNPMVGCVVVNRGRIVGEGYHRRFGGPHAEILALRQAGSKARRSSLYVTLEPCTHWGKTPPCAPELVRAGVKEVFIAMQDPNPLVAGRGIRLLRKSGIRVTHGLERDAVLKMNEAFVHWKKTGLPFVGVKMAMTLDGKIATRTGESRWISSREARAWVHRRRAEVSAVLIGASTAEKDNPFLTSHGHGRDPLRIVLDPMLRTSDSLHLYRSNPRSTLVVIGPTASSSKLKSLSSQGVQILRTSLKNGRFELKSILKYLSKINVSEILVEGGGETSWEFVRQGLANRLYVIVAPKILGGRAAPTPLEGEGIASMDRAIPLANTSSSLLGRDWLFQADLPGRSKPLG